MRESLHLLLTTVVWGLLGVFTSAGVLNGWVALEEALIAEHQYQQGDRALELIPMFVFNIGTVATVIIGFMMDRVNLRWLATLSNAAFTIGVLLLAYADSTAFNVLCVALTCMMVGGIGSTLTIYQFANLYKHPGTARSLVNAMWSVSGLLFLGVGSVNVTRYDFCRPYASFCLLMTALAYMVFPSRPYKVGDQCRIETIQLDSLLEQIPSNADKPGAASPTGSNSEGWHLAVQVEDLQTRPLSAQAGLWKSVRSWEFATLALFYGMDCAVLSWYMTTLEDQLYQAGDLNGAWSRFFVLLSCTLPIPIALLMDWHIARFQYSGTALLSALALAGSVLWLSYGSLHLCWVGFVLNTYGRNVSINLVYTRAATAFCSEQYGSIIALLTLVSVPFGLVQLLLDAAVPVWTTSIYWQYNVVFAVVSLLMASYPIYLRWKG